MRIVRILDGKISIPELPTEFVPRPAVRDLLDRAGATNLTVVSAPAGYGKSVLLADWARHRPDPVAWVSLDSTDNDRHRLWTTVRAALAAVGTAPPRPGPADRDGGDLLDELLAAVEDDGRPLGLVLDDVQELTATEPLRDLARLVRLRPPGLRLVLASRVDPPLALARIRLEGRLDEIRAEHLRFSRDDADAMLRASGTVLTAAQLQALLGRTGGWVAGLRLAALSLRRSGDRDRFLAEFSGDERSVADYLTGEMLALLDPETVGFLRVLSVCSTLSTDLATTLSGRQDAGLVLDRLLHEAALIERSPSGEHAIHALLRSYLRADLQRRGQDRYRQVETAAARWWAARGEAAHALRHAQRSGDGALLGALLRRSGVRMLLRGELDPLRPALAAAGAAGRRDDPTPALLAALVHVERRSRDVAAVELAQARLSWPQDPDAELSVLRTSAELLGGALGAGGPPDPDPRVPPGELPPESAALLRFAWGGDALLRRADPAGARAEFEAALALARASDLPFLAVHCLTLLAGTAELHDGRGGAERAREALAVAAAHGGTPAWTSGAAAVLAYTELLAGDAGGAADRAAHALAAPADRLGPEVAFALHAVRAAARADRGEGVAGLAEARAARARFGGTGGLPQWYAALAVLEHRAALMLGNPGAAATVVDWLHRRTGEVAETVLMRAWAEAVAGHVEAAAALVAVPADPEQGGSPPVLLAHTPLEIHLVRAEAQLQRGDDAAARASLGAALADGRSLDVVRPFALAGPATRAALATRGRQAGRDPFLARVVATLSVLRPEIAAPLSEREVAVLGLLPSLLSAREIAAELTVSVNTVKTHVRSIYAKLGVASRRDAVQRAQDRGLLP